jgi:hypothetical protein
MFIFINTIVYVIDSEHGGCFAARQGLAGSHGFALKLVSSECSFPNRFPKIFFGFFSEAIFPKVSAIPAGVTV